jgi:hypothetical protein
MIRSTKMIEERTETSFLFLGAMQYKIYNIKIIITMFVATLALEVQLFESFFCCFFNEIFKVEVCIQNMIRSIRFGRIFGSLPLVRQKLLPLIFIIFSFLFSQLRTDHNYYYNIIIIILLFLFTLSLLLFIVPSFYL